MPGSAVDLRRRQLLRGRVSGADRPVRPPWALPDPEFVELCQRCDACLQVCDPGILRRGDGGYPQVDFLRGGCTFCAACVAVCEPGALRGNTADADSAWRATVDIGASCLSRQGITCRTCGDRCPRRAILFRLQTGGRAEPQWTAADCDGCGVCLAVCPTGAVQVRNTPCVSGLPLSATQGSTL
jgi:ferredoxin-type protein NapF